MQLIVVLGLIAKLTAVSGDCDVGKTVHDFDFDKFIGNWFFLYHQPDEEYNNFECPQDHYSVPAGNRSRMVSFVYIKSQRMEIVSTGFLGDWDSTGYSQILDGQSKWSGRCHIVAVDYDRYVIFKLCSLGLDKAIRSDRCPPVSTAALSPSLSTDWLNLLSQNRYSSTEMSNIFVAFRLSHPDDATMEDAKKALRDNNIDFNQLEGWNFDRCRNVSVEG